MQWYKSQSKSEDRWVSFQLYCATMPKFGNVRQIMLKQRRAAKCPFVERFINLGLAYEPGSFVSTEQLFISYSEAIALFTENDSLVGQTSYLMKKRAFYKVSFQNI